MEYADLLEKFEQEHFQKCLKIEELLEEEYKELERRKKEILLRELLNNKPLFAIMVLVIA